MVELDDFLHRKPAELSGGQRQRVALARAIVRQPNVFLMDEPLSNLDAKLRVSTRAQIKNLSHELAVTTVYVTHDQIEAMTLADRVVVMKGGVVQQVGSPTDIYDHPANTFVASFIGNPAMNLMEGTMKAACSAPVYRNPRPSDAPDGPATLGFRAEDASVVPSGGQINAPIYTLELLGDATMVTVRVGARWSACAPTRITGPRSDDMVSISVPPEICHLFDGKAVSGSGPEARHDPFPGARSRGPTRDA
jgi:multiple sugar transport system ATP-binding protein